MKRARNLFPQLISDENLMRAIEEVNRTHHYKGNHRVNKTTLWVETHREYCCAELKKILTTGFSPKKPRMRTIYDPSAKKYRDIYEPAQWPDQYVHHAVIQVLEPVLMRGMDHWCCGSIRGRGSQHGMRAIKRWMKFDRKGTKYCAELDIRKFYPSLKPRIVMKRLRQLIKDREMLSLIETMIADGIYIGAFFSQWFANTVLQPLDQMIREQDGVTHYLRNMDNITIFAGNKKKLHRVVRAVSAWLEGEELELKGNWQVYPTKARLPLALGYRYGRGFCLVRKPNLLRLRRQLRRVYKKLDAGEAVPFRMAAGLISRIGQLKHCNSYRLWARLVRKGLLKKMKNVVRKWQREHKESVWTTGFVISETPPCFA